ncbi:MAG: galactokinase, partial [Pyrinomonadaceae bacterium]|nr:galactokinase [Pyrinomonadaceae bacterium]
AEAVKHRGTWLDYVEGTIRILDETTDFKGGANIVFASNVPLGAGLSSSAALEISHGLAILMLNGIEIDRVKLALAAQRAEHEFVGAKVGIMDQFTSALGATNHALLIDCRSLKSEKIPLEFQNAKIVVVNSEVKHSHANSEYNTRRQECEYAVQCLQEKLPEIKALRDVTIEDFDKHHAVMPEIIKRRARHVVTENARVLKGAENLRNGDAAKFGALMYESHASMRDDYEISCDEIDFLVETARDIKGVFGARMTGGGFGGCTVNIVEENALEEFQTKITSAYQQQFKITPEIYIVTASDGASEIERKV